MKLSKELIERIDNGDSISDDELHDAIVFYTDLVESLTCLGKEYFIAARPLRTIMFRLEGYQQARDQQARDERKRK